MGRGPMAPCGRFHGRGIAHPQEAQWPMGAGRHKVCPYEKPPPFNWGSYFN